jgi:hypothetical protein
MLESALSLSNFCMLRLIAADPSMHVLIQRYRTEGWIEEQLAYAFDLGYAPQALPRRIPVRPVQH